MTILEGGKTDALTLHARGPLRDNERRLNSSVRSETLNCLAAT